MYVHYPCSYLHATDCLWFPSWHRLRSCIDIDFAFVSTSASHYLDIGCAFYWHRLRINSNNPWNPTYLNSAELSNSVWHRLRFILTSASHLVWRRLRINSNNPRNPTYLNSAELPNSVWHRLRFILTSASHSVWHRLLIILTSAAHLIDIGFALTLTILETQPTLTLQNSQIPFDIGFALSWHRLRIRFDIGFALSWHRLRILLTSASH